MPWKLSRPISYEILSWLVAIKPDITRRISLDRTNKGKNSTSYSSKTAKIAKIKKDSLVFGTNL